MIIILTFLLGEAALWAAAAKQQGGMMLRYISMTLIILMAGILTGPDSAIGGDRFTDNGDGTITDHKLNLMWSKVDNQGDINWSDADKWVQFTFLYTVEKRYNNWRLPTLAELQSLLVEDPKAHGYETACGNWVKIVPEIELSCGWIWTSETDPIAPTARIFNFDNLYYYTERKTHKRGYRALPVRNLK
ncbi:MAG: DUF1566 domain-containing protein [Desulfobacterales bacterium]